ncbi:hypothetical protein AOA81_04640 [Methanomassiliicoccales archaeon RumEn M2]|nr:hypothetical protein AOA81_04640 [Methanomassiliicoccales archaeon RumEn M2]
MQRTRSNLDTFFTYAHTTEPSASQFLTVKEGLESHGYVRKIVHEILCSAGKMYKFLCRCNPWDEIRPKRDTKWYVVPDALFPFEKEMESFSKYLQSEPMNSVMRKKQIYQSEKALRILCYEKNIRNVWDIDTGCFVILERYLKESSLETRRCVMYSLGRFVEYHTGNDVLHRYQLSKELKFDFEATSQWKRMMESADRYLEDCKERGFTEVSRRNLRTNLTTAIRRLFRYFGPLDPEEVTMHHFRLYRNMSTDLKDRTIKINLCNMGKMLEFVTGANPYAKAKIVWTKQSIDRTWVFKDEWKAIFGSATTVERVALVLCAGMGLRRNEVATLKLSDICGNTMTIRGKGHGAGKIVEKEIPKSVMAVIQAYLPERELILRKYGDRYHDSLIVPPFYSHGERTLNTYVGNLIAEASARAGVKATCHTFRRFYCMNLLDNGFELDTVRRMMRHSSVEITLESYVCADPRKLKTATDSVDDALFG